MVAIVISNLLFFSLHLYPFRHFYYKIYQGILRTIFLLVNSIAILVNLIDIEYFRFEGRRSTADVFKAMGFGDDFVNTVPRMIGDFWYLLLILLILIFLLNTIYGRIKTTTSSNQSGFFLKTVFGQIILTSITFALCFIGFRGGIQYRPINIMAASQYANGKDAALLLNTPFTIIKTLGKNTLEPITYFSKEKTEKISPTTHHFQSSGTFRKLNVVIIIVESLGKEYSGFLNNYSGYTPFLDSLMKKSLVFTNAYANGKRSIEGIPCVIAGLPALMVEPFITSAYNGNKVSSLATALKQKGYSTLFFHGGTNGTMGFDNFTKLAGYDSYFGRREYNNDIDFDGNWGIYDEPFLQYTVQKLNTVQQPFHAGIFTISSHHPYKIPDQYKGKFKKGTLPIHESMMYADYSLKKFFEAAEKTKWFDSTLFVITGDHTALSEYQFYQNHVGMYSVPIIFYQSHDSLMGKSNQTTEQIDILPGVLDYIHYNLPFFSFGQSMFDSTADHKAVNYVNGLYQIISGEYSLSMDTSKVQSVFNFVNDSTLSHNLKDSFPEMQLKMERKLKATIQNFNNAMLNNSMPEK